MNVRTGSCRLALALSFIPLAASASTCIITGPYCTDNVGGFNLTINGSLSSSVVDQAIDPWASNCNGYFSSYATPFPTSASDMARFRSMSTMRKACLPPRQAHVERHRFSPTRAAARSWAARSCCGRKTETGVQCPVAQVLTHEFGHLYGLEQADSATCNGTIMGAQQYNTTPAFPSDTCSGVDSLWYTKNEAQNDQYCYDTCRGSCYEGYCDSSTCFQYPDGSWSSNCYSPILIDLSGNGFHLTSAAGGVAFDLNSDRQREKLSWTRDGDNAFLCLYRNHNGQIDNGGELFGNYTRLTDGSRAKNGFEALAEYDTLSLGGNGDGQLDPADAIWTFLLVWSDANHDGISQPSELQTLDQAGILAIQLRYESAHRTSR